MPITYSDLFTKLGHIFDLQDDILDFAGNTIQTRLLALAADYNSSYQVPWDVASLLQNMSQSQDSFVDLVTSLSQLASLDIIAAVDGVERQRDDTIETALAWMVRDFAAAGQTVNASAPSVAVAADPGNVGDAVVLATAHLADGTLAEYAVPETILAVVTADATDGGATAGSEPYAIYGASAVDPTAYDWPTGSGDSASGSRADASSYSSASQLLYNGDFELWTVPNTPDNWPIVVGTAGTQVIMSGTAFDGTAALAFAGDGATLTEIRQEFGSASGTASTLDPLSQYAVNFWCKVSSAPAAGTLRVSLVDGSDAIINDAAGNPNSFTVDLTTLGTTFVPKGAFFRTPRVLPPVIRIRLDLTTALSAGSNMILDRMAMTPAVPAYDSGPSLASFSGATPSAAGDEHKVAVTNVFGKFQKAFQRNFGMTSLGLRLASNSAGGETIADY